MTKLISDMDSGILLYAVPEQHKEAALNFMQFMRDKTAYSDNTLRDLKCVLRAWGKWCNEQGIAWYPIEPEAAREYLLSMHDANRASTTITKHFSMMNMMLDKCGQPNLSKNVIVNMTMRRIRREAVIDKHERTGQAVPLQWGDLKLIDALLMRSGKLVDLRNRAFLYVAYNTLLRMSEMSRIRVKDLELIGYTVTLHVGHTKTTTTAAGLDKQLAQCTKLVLDDWLNESGLSSHPDAILFPPVHRTDKVKVTETPLSAPALEKIFSDAWALVGKENAQANKGRYSTWTGHSARVGAAIDMEENGVSLAEIMREGTWKKPETVMRYLRRSRNNAGATSRLMDS
jgi:integrase